MATNINNRFSDYSLQEVGDEVARGMLPAILGTWYHVNPNKVRHYQTNPFHGQASNDGLTKETPLDTLLSAYNKCYTGRGDGIALYSQGTTSTNTTSYLTASLDWAKYNITVFGVCAGGWDNRARIAAGTTADLAYLIDVQGQNNRFINVELKNFGDANTALGSLKVTGSRNRFVGSHIVGCGHATPAAVAHAAGTSLGGHDLNLGASLNRFENCIFGDNTIIRAAANANIVLSAQQSKNDFIDCRIMSYSATAGKGAIALYAANALNGWITFKNCSFTNWNPGAVTAHTSVLIGATPNNCGILIQNCGMIGWALWDSATGNDKVYITHGAGHATGGLGIVAS